MRSLSPFSDPIQAGINTFKEVTGVLQSYDDREMEKQRFNEDIKDKATLRQARELDIAEKKKRADEEEANKPLREQERKVRMQELTKKSQDLLTEPVRNNFTSGIQKLSNGNGDLTDDELTAQAIAVDQSYDLNKMTPQEIDEYGKNVRYLRNYMTQITPLIQEQIKKGGGTLTRASMPEVFNAIDKMPFLGGDINKGGANDGQPAKSKKLDSIIISPDPSGQFMGMMTFKLQVENQKGDTYYAPLTPGRSGDPNEQVLQIPIELFAANVEQRAKFAEAQEPIIKKYGFDGYAKILADGKREHKTMQAYASGSDAVDALLKENPKADANTIRTAAMKSIMDKAKELGVAIDPAKMKAFVGEWIDEKKQGDTDAPEIKLAKQYQQLSPEYKKAFQEVQEAKKEKPAPKSGGETEEDFKNWSPDAKESAFKNKVLNKEEPKFGMGQNPSRKQFFKEYNEWLAKNNISAEDVATGRAAAKFQQSTQTMQSKAILSTINPLLDKLEKAGGVLGNSNLPGYNRAVNFLKEQTGQSDIVAFNNLRDDVVAEVERGLLGTGVLSDFKYQRAVKNINSAQSMSQLKAAISNTKAVIDARLNVIKEASPQPDGINKPKGRELSNQSQGQPNNDAIEAIKKIAKGNGPDAERAKKLLKKNGIQY